MNKKHKVKWKTSDDSSNLISFAEQCRVEIFDDILFKDYGVRVTMDELNKTYIIPYTSIYEIEIINETT